MICWLCMTDLMLSDIHWTLDISGGAACENPNAWVSCSGHYPEAVTAGPLVKCKYKLEDNDKDVKKKMRFKGLWWEGLMSLLMLCKQKQCIGHVLPHRNAPDSFLLLWTRLTCRIFCCVLRGWKENSGTWNDRTYQTFFWSSSLKTARVSSDSHSKRQVFVFKWQEFPP